MDKMIFGITGCSSFLGISSRTIARYVQKGIFPTPELEQECQGRGTMRWWAAAPLKKFKNDLINKSTRTPGRPVNIREKKDTAKLAE